MPAIIVAGGPSLRKNVRALSRARGKFVIIAADTVVPLLIQNGIVPDFVTTIDMQDITIEKVVDIAPESSELSLVCSSWVTPLIPKNIPSKRVLWTFSAKHMEKWLSRCLGGSLLTTGAGTVAHLSFTTAIILGCSPIVFVGQDLAFTNQETHAQATSLTSDQYFEELLKGKEVLTVEAWGGGGQVPTSRAFLGHKVYFENAIKKCADRLFINATEGGARIAGALELPLAEVIERHGGGARDVSAVREKALAGARRPGRSRSLREFSKVLKMAASARKDLARVADLVKSLGRAVKELSASVDPGSITRFEALPTGIQKGFSELDRVNARLDNMKIWDLLDELTFEGLRQSERMKHELATLARSPGDYLEWLRKSLARFDLITRVRRQSMEAFAGLLEKAEKTIKLEARLLKKIASGKERGDRGEALQGLMRLYYDSGDHVLLEQVLQCHPVEDEWPAGFHFYLGTVELNRSRFDEADRHFSLALKHDTSLKEEVVQARRAVSARYLNFARNWMGNDLAVSSRMLIKALKAWAGDKEVRGEITALVDRVLEDAETRAREGNLDGMSRILDTWMNGVNSFPGLREVLGAERSAALLRFSGELRMAQQDYQEAVSLFEQALSLSPGEAQLHARVADALFAMGSFDDGVKRLDEAVALNPVFARGWEQIGDFLFDAGQVADAALAYEKCFKALPEDMSVLNKIARCNAVLG